MRVSRTAITKVQSAIAIVIIAAAAAVGFAFYITTSGSPNTTSNSTISGPKTMGLGFIFSYTGYLGVFAQTQDEGARAAVSYINSHGGVKMPWGNVTIVPYFKDDALSTTQAISDYNELYQTNHVSAVIGGSFGAIISALGSQAKKTNTVYWPTGVTPLALIKNGTAPPGYFGTLPTIWSIGYTACSYVLNTLHKTNIYFLYRPDLFGAEQKVGCDAAMAQYGGTYAGTDEYPAGTPDFTSYIAKVQNTPNVQALLTVSFGTEVPAFVSAVYNANLTSKMTVFDTFTVTQNWQGVPANEAAGILGLDYFYYNFPNTFPANFTAPASAFVNYFNSTFGYPPDAYAASTWISVMNYIHAVEGIGTTTTPTPQQLDAYYAANPNVDTVMGPATYGVDRALTATVGYMVVSVNSASQRTSVYDVFTVIGYVSGKDSATPLSLTGFG